MRSKEDKDTSGRVGGGEREAESVEEGGVLGVIKEEVGEDEQGEGVG